ncbi:hypothetical protein [Bacillus haynesii]|uniref:hypothetical protein n=1 Tax=Bacillus haynesii TaxID=1925021 RepID=UPI0022825194|nr:hypothetical protein [Bacillus haynesii]MCY8093734.1 hypothetical protein [Bacillus haynesii]MCY8293142.1 hypothetical protein [Bacillus haynesii]MCY8408660.1 hypothetical protein [Bacillus haynesii]MCY8433298.1 hypothetical protein [Bacillus haynesii]MCY8543220.1 hypothetical protein [Bacillus haynesii]
MSKIKWIITLTICAALAFSLFIFFNKANFTKASENKETGLFFARNYISYVMEDETMSFNIFGLQKTNTGVPISGDTVTSLAFDNDHIQISDYKVETGIRHKGYMLVNIIVDVRISSDKPEKTDQLLISFNGCDREAFQIGKITLQNEHNVRSGDLSPAGQYTAGYPKPSLDVRLKNNLAKDISLEKITDLNSVMTYTFDKGTAIQAKQSKHIVVPSFDLTGEYDFYTVTPVLRYTAAGKRHQYSMPGVLYGALDSDEEKIERILKHQ